MSSNYDSPCILVCQLDANKVCIGCGRTIDEIKNWLKFTDKERRQIILRIKMTEKSFVKHIDNGGVTIAVESSEDGNFITLETQYFGYPSVKSSFSDYGWLTADDYRKIGAMFTEFAAILES